MRVAQKSAVIVSSGCGVLIASLMLWRHWHLIEGIDINAWVERIARFGPWPFFVAMATLPAFWIPVSPFLLLAGAIYSLPIAISGTILALSTNMAVSWLLAGALFRPFFERLVGRFGYSVPKLSDKSMLQVAFLLRITPGMPFPFQNYTLGLARMPFFKYMLVSVPTSTLMSISIIIFGDALLKGDGAMILSAIALFALITIVVSRVRQRLKQRQLEGAA